MPAGVGQVDQFLPVGDRAGNHLEGIAGVEGRVVRGRLPAEPDVKVAVPGHIFDGKIRDLFDGDAHLDRQLAAGFLTRQAERLLVVGERLGPAAERRAESEPGRQPAQHEQDDDPGNQENTL